MRDRLTGLISSTIPSGSVFERALKSGFWVGAIRLLSRFLQILMLIMLARILAPRDFGLMGVALVTLGATKKFTNIGLNAALIHGKADDVDEYLDTTWCLEAGRGLLIAGVLFVAAPVIASFFQEPQVTALIRVIAIGPFLHGLRNPGVVYFQKDLEFHKEFVYQVSGGIAQVVVGVGYALYWPTVWALVFGFLAADAAKFLVSYLVHSYRPWPAVDREAAIDLIDYGKWITGSSIIYFLYSQGDDAFVGWFLSATALGFYQYAYRIADAPATEISEVVSSVAFPAFSQIQEDPVTLQNAVLTTTRVTSFVTIPMALGIVLVAPSFVPVVLGPAWRPMVLTMQLLALFGMIHAVTRFFGSFWKAIGRPDVVAKLGLLRVLCIAVLIWPLTARWGIEGTALTVVGVYIVPMVPLEVYLLSREISVKPVEIYRHYAFPLGAGLVMFLSLRYVRPILSLPPSVELVSFIPAGVGVYLVSVVVLERQFDWGIKRDIRRVVSGVRQ